jgi:hypothetical protein
MEIRQCSQAVLDKYGLTREEWQAMWDAQGKRCPICEKEPKTQSPTEFMVDHKHVRKWKTMLPEERKKYVRGLVCQWCNRSYISKAITVEKAKNIIIYLQKFESKNE